MSANATPSLDDLIENPSKAANVAPEAAQLLLIQLAAIQPVLIQRALSAKQNEPDEMDLLTAPAIATLLKVSEYKAYELVRQGKIRKTSIDDSVRVKRSDLREYIDRNRD